MKAWDCSPREDKGRLTVLDARIVALHQNAAAGSQKGPSMLGGGSPVGEPEGGDRTGPDSGLDHQLAPGSPVPGSGKSPDFRPSSGSRKNDGTIGTPASDKSRR